MAESRFNLHEEGLLNKWLKGNKSKLTMDPCKTISKSKAKKQEIWNMLILYPEMPTGVSGHQISCPVNWKKKTVLLI